jgi:hypothetical protein
VTLVLKDKTIIDVSNTEKSIVNWIKYLQSSCEYQLAATFETDNASDFQLIHDLQLPTYDSYQMSVAHFLEIFHDLQKIFIHNNYYLVLLPMEEKHKKFYVMNIRSLEEAKSFLTQSIKGWYDQYLLRISEFEPNIYGGSIISDNGIVIVEMVKGLQSNVANGTTNVISGVLTSLNISMRYSTSDELERHLLWNALKTITRENKEIIDATINHIELHTIRNLSFLKGYFEFAYVKKNDNFGLRLVFFDLKLKKAYYDLNSYYHKAQISDYTINARNAERFRVSSYD